MAWATDAEHSELERVVRPIVAPHVGPPRPWGGIPGVAVGLIRGGKQYFFPFGDARPGRPVDRTSVFEIGSITKTFTGLLLADAVHKGKVRIDDPANAFLPERLRLPSRNRKEITLRHLATHRSGLPPRICPLLRDAVDFVRGNRRGLSLSMEALEAWLETAALERDPGVAWSYSNLGSSFLAFALEAREGRPWASLVADLVTAPLGMSATRLMDDTSVPEKALGHTFLGLESSRDSVTQDSAYAPAGALRSNMQDMLRSPRRRGRPRRRKQGRWDLRLPERHAVRAAPTHRDRHPREPRPAFDVHELPRHEDEPAAPGGDSRPARVTRPSVRSEVGEDPRLDHTDRWSAVSEERVVEALEREARPERRLGAGTERADLELAHGVIPRPRQRRLLRARSEASGEMSESDAPPVSGGSVSVPARSIVVLVER